MYEKLPLGSGWEFDKRILKIIDPRLDSLSVSGYSKHVNAVLGSAPGINKDIDAFFRDNNLAPDETSKQEVNSLYLKLKKDGLIHYGRVKNKEHMILYSLGQLELCSETNSLLSKLTLDKLQKMEEGHRRYWRRWFAKRGIITRSRFDKHSAVVYDWDKWIRSYEFPEGMSDEEKREFIATINLKSAKMKNKFEMKLLMHTSDIHPNWITLLRKLYCIKCLEKEEGRVFLKSNPELWKIWGIPRTTWGVKMDFLSMLDEDF